MTNNAHRHRPRVRVTLAAPAAPVRNNPNNVVPIHRGGYSVAEVAEILSVPSTTVCGWARTGLVPARKIGRRWVIPRCEFDAWIDDLPEATDTDIDRDRRRHHNHAARRRLAPGAPRRQ